MSRKVPFEKSFAAFEDKQKVNAWHKTKNSCEPKDAYMNTHKKYWFLCHQCGHDFEMTLHHIASEKRYWCSYCCIPQQKLCPDFNCKACYEKSFASFSDKSKVDAWHKTKNRDKTPRDVFIGSGAKQWFLCNDCGHDFHMSPHSITTKGSWCSYCKGAKLCDYKDCKICMSKSFASAKKIYLDTWMTERNKCTPRDVFKCTARKYWFHCSTCEHDYQLMLSNISRNGAGCPYCAKPSKVLCSDEKCVHCFKRSFASFKDKEKVEAWHPTKNGDKTPRNVFISTASKYWFICYKCGHDYHGTISHITSGENKWCHYCCQPALRLCSDDKCKMCFEKSFASFDKEKVKCWVYEKNKGKKPRDVFKYSRNKYWFKCLDCNEDFNSCIYSLTQNNTWCPKCKNKTEKKLFKYLKTIFEDVKHGYRVNWCKNIETKRYLPFDFVIPSLKVIVELDGGQHFQTCGKWGDHKEIQKRDKYKMNCALEKGYTIVRLLQHDVWFDINDWKRHLNNALRKYEKPERVYLSTGSEYDCYMEE